ncbi:hypothetical protein SSU98_0418 [Streptococcus suis 98HAH33]|nr:hypothetical protein SSU05_0431 [Streptococcus suis 05ZYH33]ABP91575.1 hypothetical protein SSU98_0418 [Streptococcus suis 98HAH33]
MSLPKETYASYYYIYAQVNLKVKPWLKDLS